MPNLPSEAINEMADWLLSGAVDDGTLGPAVTYPTAEAYNDAILAVVQAGALRLGYGKDEALEMGLSAVDEWGLPEDYPDGPMPWEELP